MSFNERGFIMGWTVSNIVADTRAKAVKADILFQMSGSKVLYVSNCALSTIFVAYCEKRGSSRHRGKGYSKEKLLQ